MLLYNVYRIRIKALLLLPVLLLCSCNNCIPFDSEQWKNAGGENILTNERLLMTKDLLEKNLILNKSVSEMDSILGPSFRFGDSDSGKRYYMVQEVYSRNIDPDELIFLEVTLDKSGVSTKVEVKHE